MRRAATKLRSGMPVAEVEDPRRTLLIIHLVEFDARDACGAIRSSMRPGFLGLTNRILHPGHFLIAEHFE